MFCSVKPQTASGGAEEVLARSTGEIWKDRTGVDLRRSIAGGRMFA